MDYQDLLHTLFDHPKGFDHNTYKTFIHELCKEVPGGERLLPTFDSEKSHVKTKSRLGRYTDPKGKKLDFLEIELDKESTLYRGRLLQRNIVSNYLKSDEGVYQNVDHIIAVFYVEDCADWRLSFVKQSFTLDPDKNNIINEFTPAKRFSFLIENKSKNQTVIKQSLPLLQANEKPLIAEIEHIFSVEKVTKEFFAQYKDLYNKLIIEFDKDRVFQNMKARGDDKGDPHFTANFVKKLLGQIVFLYFLQKKGWLGVAKGAKRGTGETAFLRRLYDHCVRQDTLFFDEYLEYLFYDALNRKREDDRYEKFNCKIPYLNGGLFQPINDYDWQGPQNVICVPNEIFGQILDVFDTYNFTIYENDPLEQDVAVDPEMLGKIFENLLPDNERKGKGAFYTPREIVHYMCKQSLLQHLVTATGIQEERLEKFIAKKDSMYNLQKLDDLKISEADKTSFRTEAQAIDNALKEVKIIDPAVGSGAFPMGMLKEIVDLRRYIKRNILGDKHSADHNLIYNLKKETLSHCIYGVDLDPGAVEIAKLRFWLSLVVDFEGEYIEPLPNLDYKIMQGNSLIQNPIIGDQVIDLGLEDKTKVDKTTKNMLTQGDGLFVQESGVLLKRMQLLHDDFFKANDPDHKKKLKQELQALELKLISQKAHETIQEIEAQVDRLNDGLMTDKKSKEVAHKYETISQIQSMMEHLQQQGVKNYFPWRLHFGEIFREHGGFDIVIGNPPYIKERDNAHIFDPVNKSDFGKKYHQGKMDFWYYFLHKAFDIAKQETGYISFITNSYWMKSNGSSKLIDRIKKEATIDELIDFGDLKVFPKVAGRHMVHSYQNCKMDANSKTLLLFVSEKDFEKGIIDPKKGIYRETNKIIQGTKIHMDENQDFVEEKKDDVLDNFFDVSQGVVEATDKISKKMAREKLGSEDFAGEGVFVLGKKDLINSGVEKTLLKKYINTNDVSRYNHNHQGEYLIYSDRNFIDELKKGKYPLIRNHLDSKQDFITSSNKPYGIHRARKKIFFESPKLICKGMFKMPEFTYDDEGYFVGMSFSVIISKNNGLDLKYLLACMNSSLGAYRFLIHGKKRGVGVDVGVKVFRQFPVIKISPSDQQPFIDLVDQILEKKKTDPTADTSDLEAQIDQMVYELYGLTEEEISIVEGS